MRRALLACAVLASSGCSPEPAGVRVQLSLEQETCGSSAMEMSIACPGTLWVGVERFDGTVLTHDCLQISDDGLALVDLGNAMASSISLEELPTGTPLRLVLLVAEQGLEGCPATVPTDVPTLGLPILAGFSDYIDLGTGGELNVPLTCYGDFEGEPPPNGCDQCNEVLGFCLEGAGAQSCDAISSSCRAKCVDGDNSEFCQGSCEYWFERCDDQGETGPFTDCEPVQENCEEQCGEFPEPEFCIAECQRLPHDCFEVQQIIRECQLDTADCYENCTEAPPPVMSCFEMGFPAP